MSDDVAPVGAVGRDAFYGVAVAQFIREILEVFAHPGGNDARIVGEQFPRLRACIHRSFGPLIGADEGDIEAGHAVFLYDCARTLRLARTDPAILSGCFVHTSPHARRAPPGAQLLTSPPSG